MEGEEIDVDDLVCDVQDAYFEGRYNDVIRLGHELLEKFPEEEDTYDLLLASHLALGQYEDVLELSGKWVEACGESLKQLVLASEAAYMLQELALLEDAAYKLCFLFEGSGQDEVFVNGALQSVALALDSGISFPESTKAEELLKAASMEEPIAWWVARRLGHHDAKFIEGKDEQARDLQRCLEVLLLEGEAQEQAKEKLKQSKAVDASGAGARTVFLGEPLPQHVPLCKIHPLFRRRLGEEEKE